MPYFNIVAQTSENTVVTEYEPVKARSDSYQSEAELEREFIRMLTEQGYEYLTIHSEAELIANLKKKLETLNNYIFSDSEWDRFFKDALANPNDHIVEKTRKIQEDFVQVLKRDDGSTKNITLIDKKNIHNNLLQVINQYAISQNEGARHSNRYDVTILVNGFPMIHSWMEDLSIKMSSEEGAFLRQQIITAYPDSMLAFILRNSVTEIFVCKTFQELESLIKIFPEQIQNDYSLAYAFSSFLLVLRVVYNIVVSAGQNEAANALWEKFQPDISELADVDLDAIFARLSVYRNVSLCAFLRKAQGLMKNADLDGLKTEIKRRERELKTSRAKTLHPGEFDRDAWFGGGELDYRFGNAKVIIGDIFESEGTYAESK